jgi:hypothetical protein
MMRVSGTRWISLGRKHTYSRQELDRTPPRHRRQLDEELKDGVNALAMKARGMGE